MLMTFRKDINGLRAIAVIAVVLFHFKIMGFSGGFTGVDVFFVISGYLMTAIIFSRIREAKFSIIDFYISRAKRIIPALIVLCITLILFGLCYLQTEDYRELLRNIKSSTLFFSNISYYNKTGYFDTPTQENWLLHTWSLSVEWQFYIFYPIIIALLSKIIKERLIKVILAIIALISLTLAISLANTNPTAAFYLLPSRAWEMLAGAIVFLFPLKLSTKIRFNLELVGLVMVIMSIFYFNANFPWPSYYTLLPIMGTMLILYGNRESFITGNFVSQFLGKISYSIYLWHWPIAVFLYFCGLAEQPTFIIGGIITSLLLATFSYYSVEQVFSKFKNSRNKTAINYLVIVIIIGGILSPSIASLAKKYPRKTLEPTAQTNPPTVKKHCLPKDDFIVDCQLGEGQITTIILGDSHAGSIASAVQAVNPQKSLLWYRGGCPTLNEYEFKSNKENTICHSFTEHAFKRLATSYQGVPLIVINRASLYLDPADIGGHFVSFKGFEHKVTQDYLDKYRQTYLNSLCTLAKNRPVYLVKPIPEMRTNVLKSLQMQSHFITNIREIVLPLEQYQQRHLFVLSLMNQAKQQCGIELLDPIPYLCPDGKNCMGSLKGRALYADDNHLNGYGSALLEPLFKPIFDQKASTIK